MRLLLALCLLSSCGKRVEAQPPHGIIEELQAEVERIKPLLLFGCGLPRESNQDCSGDGLSMAGRWLLDGRFADGTWEAMKASIDPDGKPWRNSNRPEFDGGSFSRDQYLGLIEATVATGDGEPLRRVRAYAKANGNLLCPMESKCRVTPSVNLLAYEATGGRASVLERAQDEATLISEASANPPTYQSYLVMRKLNLWHELGHDTPGYRQAASILVKRFPKHIFARYVNVKMNGGDMGPVATDLLACMKSWNEPGTEWWGGAFDGCSPVSQGHELVALAKAVQR
jgi:hypothetical protein